MGSCSWYVGGGHNNLENVTLTLGCIGSGGIVFYVSIYSIYCVVWKYSKRKLFSINKHRGQIVIFDREKKITVFFALRRDINFTLSNRKF